MNEKMVSYSIVSAEYTSYLEIDVRIKMQEGWQPLGGPFPIVRSSHHYGQAMVKYEIKTYEPVSTDRRIEPNL